MAIADLKKDILISVVIPTRNRAALLHRALKSVREQRGIVAERVEIIVIDDCSDDDTPAVAAASGVRYLRNDRRSGGAAARNRGVQMACGSWIAFLDDDDEWLPDKLARQLDETVRSGADMSATGFRMVDASGRTLQVYRGRNYRDTAGVLRRLAHDNFIGTASGVMVRAEVFRKVGMFNEAFTACQDYEMWIRIIEAGHRFRFVRVPLVVYHYHAGQRISVSTGAVQGYRRFVHTFRGLIDRYGLRRYHVQEILYRTAKQHLFAGDRRGFLRNLRRAVRVYPWVPSHTLLRLMPSMAEFLHARGMVK